MLDAVEQRYQRLLGRSRSAWGHHELWLGTDHLLAIETAGYIQRYHRVEYGDVLAVHSRQTRHWWVRLLVLAAAACIPIKIGFIGTVTSTLAASFVGGILGGLALLSLLHGRSVQTTLYTAVQALPLPSLNTVSKAKRGMDELRKRIILAQGAHSPEASHRNPPELDPQLDLGAHSSAKLLTANQLRAVTLGLGMALLCQSLVATLLLYVVAHAALAALLFLLVVPILATSILTLVATPEQARVRNSAKVVVAYGLTSSGLYTTLGAVLNVSQRFRGDGMISNVFQQLAAGATRPGLTRVSFTACALGGAILGLGVLLQISRRAPSPSTPTPPPDFGP